MKRVAILGAGVMGKGITEALLPYGYKVFLHDKNENVLNMSRKEIEFVMKINSLQGFSFENNCFDNLHLVECLDMLKNIDLIIENITENFGKKEELYKKLSKVVQKNTIVFVNTSSIPISRLAEMLPYPDKVIGVHFMNPVPLMKSVEVIISKYTSQDTIDATIGFLEKTNKKAIKVKDCPGFISNRISHILMNEAAFIVQDNEEKPEVVDQIFRECYSHKMGPLETADLIGIDTVVNTLDELYYELKSEKYICCQLLRDMVRQGKRGVKSGEGFYRYR